MKLIFKGLLSIILCYVLILQGCSTTWIVTLDTVLAVLAPAINNVITIVDLSQNKPVDQVLENKITADAANLKILAADFAAGSGLNPSACQEVQAAVAVLNDDSAVVLKLVQATGSSNIAAIFASADAFVMAVTGLIPTCNTPLAIKTYKSSVPAKVAKIDVNSLIKNYNSNLTHTTGNALVDNYAKANKVHYHSFFVRTLTLNRLQ